MTLMDDLRGRLANRVLLTMDSHKAYLEAVEESFDSDVDHAMLVELYDEPKGTVYEGTTALANAAEQSGL